MRVECPWRPVPWYLRWRGRERRLITQSDWYFDFVAEYSRHWEYRW